VHVLEADRRGGNRQINAALHRIAVTQLRLDGLGRAYYQR